MRKKARKLFPGGNTPEGFYSYYHYILDQKEATAIICLKGGPGTGKSSFMKGIAEYFTGKGENIDYFYCSSDPGSLDGILLKEKKVAVLDGTSPHIVDPKTPGAVDMIVNLGECWDGGVIRQYKDHIMQSSSMIRNWFEYGYNSLNAAARLRKSVRDTYTQMMIPGELYKEAAGIVNRELSKYPVTLSAGKVRRLFASAITPDGTVNHLDSLTEGYGHIYCLMAPQALDTAPVLRIISDQTVHRGFAVEEFYCPMRPEEGLEHLLIPELDLAFITLNKYHDMEMCGSSAEVTMLEMRDYIDWNGVERYKDVTDFCCEQSDRLIAEAIGNFKRAKAEHDILESYYIPNMNFQKIDRLRTEIIGKIERKVL